MAKANKMDDIKVSTGDKFLINAKAKTTKSTTSNEYHFEPKYIFKPSCDGNGIRE